MNLLKLFKINAYFGKIYGNKLEVKSISEKDQKIAHEEMLKAAKKIAFRWGCRERALTRKRTKRGTFKK